jgi:hypothetical protein
MPGAGTISQLPSGRWRLRVPVGGEGRQLTYGTYTTEELAAIAQSRWRLTHLLPADDPEQAVDARKRRGGRGALRRVVRSLAGGQEGSAVSYAGQQPPWRRRDNRGPGLL